MIFTGNGKGKTTAALGQAMRAAGHGKRTLMVQFIKGPWISGEDLYAERFSSHLCIKKTGKGFVGIEGDKLPKKEHRKAALDGIRTAKEYISNGSWHILILDEIWNALSLGLLRKGEINSLIRDTFPYVEHLITTGRDCPADYIAIADIVTEMKEIRHIFRNKQTGSISVEY